MITDAEVEQQLHDAFAALAARTGRDCVGLTDLRREMTGIDREQLDRVIKSLRRSGRYVLTSAERAGSFSPEDRAASIREFGDYMFHLQRTA